MPAACPLSQLGNPRSMKVAIVKERRAFERRVAGSPDTVKRMVERGLEIAVESGAGAEASFTDDAFAAAGASIAPDAASNLSRSSRVACSRPSKSPGRSEPDRHITG